MIADKTIKDFYRMDDIVKFEGTLISARVPFQTKEVNIYDYIDK